MTPTARPSPTPTRRCRPASRRTTRAPAGSAAAPTPRARPATSRPRTWSGCCAAWASSAGSTSSRSSTPACGWRVTWAGPAPPPSYERCRNYGRILGMADVVYLHVGAPKTGTTYIQDRLALNRTQLARHDVRYPLGSRGDMFHAALDLIERPWGGMLPEAKGEWEALVKRTRRAHGSAVISHEILAGATGEQVERAVTSLAPAEIHVVLTARDIARQVPAEWQERLKHQGRMRYGKFVRRIEKPRSEIGRSFWQVQGVTQVLERWSRQLPPDRVHVVTVPQPGAPHGELWRRFCRAVDVDPAWAPLDSVRRNPSIGAPESAMLRQLNDRLRRTGLEDADYRTLVRHLIVHETLATEPVEQRITLPPDYFAWAEEVFDSWR